MTDAEAIARVIDALEATGTQYMIVGSLSSNLYGFARFTKDADFVIESRSGALRAVMAALGDPFRLEPQATFETLSGTMRRAIHVKGSDFAVELFQLSADEFDRERFARRRQIQFPLVNRPVFAPSAEDVVIMKLRWGRGKDLDDLRGIIAVQGRRLDWNLIERWADRHGTRRTLDEIRAELPSTDELT